jgi:hypothetical protein
MQFFQTEEKNAKKQNTPKVKNCKNQIKKIRKWMDKKSVNILFDIDLKGLTKHTLQYPPTGYILYIFYIGTVP